MKWLIDWLDDRTGYRHLLREALEEPIPGGARWRYVWGSTLTFTFVLQMITGFMLWTAYSPSTNTAWESVYYIQHEMTFGWIVRGLHHFAAQAMVILLAIHLIQVIIDGAYRAPREINFWLGLILAQIVLALSLTGYLLPWDQKGYYATQVTTKIIGAVPVVGSQIQLLAQGGPEYGHHTLTRFFAMHAGLLPALLVGFLGLHLYVFRRHGITVPEGHRGPTTAFWPDQVLRDAVACLGVLAVLLLLTIARHGAELSAPANPAEAFSAARPEWYFLFLFRFLRFEAIEHFGLAFGALYVPGAIMTFIAMMPIIAYIRGGHRFNVAFMTVLALGVLGLTGLAIVEDYRDSDHQAAIAEAERDGHRAVELANLPTKIPVEGAGAMLEHDPLTQGPRLFAQHCAACHRFDGHNGRGRPVMEKDPISNQYLPGAPTAPDLGKFASREWWKEILLDFENHFSSVARSGYDLEASRSEGMISWATENRASLENAKNSADVDALIEFFLAQSNRPGQDLNPAKIARGKEIIDSGELTEGSISTCTNCHASVGDKFIPGAENGGIPELNGYGSAEWLRTFIEDPGHEQFYGEKNKMPAFTAKLSKNDLDLLVRYLVGDYAPTELSPYEAAPEVTAVSAGTATQARGSSEPQTPVAPLNEPDTAEPAESNTIRPAPVREESEGAP